MIKKIFVDEKMYMFTNPLLYKKTDFPWKSTYSQGFPDNSVFINLNFILFINFSFDLLDTLRLRSWKLNQERHKTYDNHNHIYLPRDKPLFTIVALVKRWTLTVQQFVLEGSVLARCQFLSQGYLIGLK